MFGLGKLVKMVKCKIKLVNLTTLPIYIIKQVSLLKTNKMTSSSSKNYLLSSTIFIILLTSLNTNGATNQLGFTVEIIHRDSPDSPFYDNSTTPYQKSLNALRRSMKRATHFFPEIKSSFDDLEVEIISQYGD